MRKADLRMNEVNKYEVIKNLVEKNGNKHRAAIKLGCSLRNIYRLINKFNTEGKEGFVHGNRDRKPAIAKKIEFKENIVNLYKTKYLDHNFNHFRDELEEVENINVSYAFVYQTLMAENITSPKIQKKTRRELAIAKIKKENKELNNQEILEKYANISEIADAHPRRASSKYFGELIQMDASQHFWFGNTKTHLHLAIDDCTGEVVGAYLDTQETLNGYYNVFKHILENYGIPYKFLTDNRTVFNYNRDGKSSAERDILTQFGYACKIFGTALETTSVAQAKGKIERLNQSFQSRLTSELRSRNIEDIHSANKYLQDKFLEKYNKKFSNYCKSIPSAFEDIPNERKINETLAIIDTRVVDNGNSIKYKQNYYQLYHNDKLQCFNAKVECLVIKCFDNTLVATVGETVYELRELATRSSISQEIDTLPNPEPKKEKKKYIPPMSHPWKLSSYKQQLEKSHNKKEYA